MDCFTNDLIDAFGGTTIVAGHMLTGVSTVHNWRRNGIPTSRLDHLRRIRDDEGLTVDIEAIALRHGVTLPVSPVRAAASSGTSPQVSAEVSA
jgi:hypothetical protein